MRSGILTAAVIIFSFQAIANSLPFSYSLFYLGGEEYQYDYSIYNNGSLGSGVALQLFDLYFDPALYTVLSSATSSQWSGQVFPAGGGLPADFDVLAVNGGTAPQSTATGFSVDFDWLGQGLPGSQPFTVSDPNSFATIQSGNTIDPITLSAFQGGTTSDPASLPAGSLVGSVSGAIGGNGSQEYYSFLWAGGAFDVAASITGATNSGASYILTYGLSGSAGCSNLGTATLNGGDNFMATLGNNAALTSGTYCIGIDANSVNDPGFTITFNTPVESTAPIAPEPSTVALLLGGAGIISVLRAKKRGRKAKA